MTCPPSRELRASPREPDITRPEAHVGNRIDCARSRLRPHPSHPNLPARRQFLGSQNLEERAFIRAVRFEMLPTLCLRLAPLSCLTRISLARYSGFENCP